MRLTSSFTVPLPVGEAWTLLRDVERVADWVPGAQVSASENGAYAGSIRVKLGPMVVDYRGTARFLEEDEELHRVRIEASGRETRGSGTATATFTATLTDAAEGTQVDAEVDLAITGRPAQLGHALMQDVAERIVAEFAARMAADLGASRVEGEPESPVSSTARSGPEESDVLDLGRLGARPVLKRLAWVLAGLACVAWCWRLWRRRAG